MNLNMSFEERSKLAKKLIFKQLPVTLEEAKRVKGSKPFKEQETKELIKYINQHKFLVAPIFIFR